MSCLVVDCRDPEQLAHFWSGLLNLPIKDRRGPYVWLAGAPGTPTLVFQRVPEPKVGKNRVHLDLVAEDIGAAVKAVVAAGGARVPGYEEGGFLVMGDPEGNEFCILPAGDWEMDADGRAHYL